MGTQGCYFYQQTCFRATPKRFRKLPEELPDSLKFAHLNPKLAALMANKEKQKQDEMMDVLSKRSIMSEINTTFQNFKSQFDFVLLNDEDSQRYLFEEAKFTAGNTLEQLASFIYRYKNIVKIIPKSLEYQMLSSYQELIADIVYMPREWQILSMKEPLSKCSDNNSEEDKTVIDEDVRIARPSSEPGKYKKKHTTKVGMPEITEEHKTDKTSNRRNDSRNSMTVSRAKNRLEKGKSTLLNDKLTGGSSVRSPDLKKGAYLYELSTHAGSPFETKSMGNPHYMSVIHFELSSKTCEDKGWILKKGNEQEIDRERLLEWCIQILQQSIKSTIMQHRYSKEQGYDKPVQVRYYGDSRMETLIKYRKSPVKQELNPALHGQKPCIPSLLDDKNEDKKLMLSGHSDGTIVVHYPSGRTAIIHSSSGYGRPGCYTIAYDDSDDMKMLAYFTPSGIGCVYHSNGTVRFLATNMGGHLAEKDGSVTRKWKWPAANVKIANPLSLQLNSSIGFRCIALSQMAIYYNNEKESAKFLVSPVAGTEELNCEDENEELLTTFNFTSNSAREMLRFFNPRLKQKKKKKDKNKSESCATAELLEYPDVTMYGTQAEKDLAKLQRKAKNVVDDWLEHYRIAIGLTSPSLNGLRDMPSSRRRYSQSAKLSNTDFLSRGTMLGVDFSKKSSSKLLRAPSAPSGQTKSNRPSTCNNLSLDHQGTLSSLNEITERVVAGGDSETVSPSTLAVMNRLISASSTTPSARCKSTTPQPTQLVPFGNTFLLTSCENCPIVLRQRMLGHNLYCRCSRYNITSITDLEFDQFICKVAPNAQLQVVVIVSTLFPKCNHALEMLEKMYSSHNRNRMRPCPQGRNDTERFLKYDINTAANNSNHTQPLLLTRHNAVPGMILIYSDGNLLFCDHIFNGYGNTKKDFKKQIIKSRLDAIHGVFLPKDFRFSPSQGHHGPRSAWGGEIGGAGVDNYGSPGTTIDLISERPSSEEWTPPVLSV